MDDLNVSLLPQVSNDRETNYFLDLEHCSLLKLYASVLFVL